MKNGTKPSSANLQKQVPANLQDPVLLVDDNEMVGAAVASVLEFHGFHVRNVTSPTAAIDVFHENQGKILILITDVVMPGMSGLQLAEHLRSIRPSLPVLYLSGYSDEAALRGSQLGENTAFLRKPVPRDQLLATIQELIRA